MASSSRSSAPPNTAMAEAQNIHTGPSQQSLQCPRCSSSNTKFCYYNNYSLSQPRHFCKACKRYWTRGGTLRNVPVGGGCRRNKRLKRPQSSSSRGVDGAAAVTTSVSGLPNTKVNSSSPPLNRVVSNPLIYGGLPASNNLLEPLHSRFSGLGSTRVSDEKPGFEFQHQVNGLGLRFSSGLVNGPPFSWSSSPFSTSVFGSAADCGPSSTMASLLASTFQQQKLGANSSFHSMISEPANGESGFHHGHGVTGTKDVKVEGENGLSFLNPNPIDQLMNSMDPSSLLWSTANLGSWPDSSNSNMGSSVSSLI